MHPLTLLQALGRPVLLSGPPSAFRDAGLILRDSLHVDDGLTLYAVLLPVGSALRAEREGGGVLLPSGVRLVVRPGEGEQDGLCTVSIVDDSASALEAGARVLISLGLPLQRPPLDQRRHDHPQPHGPAPRPQV